MSLGATIVPATTDHHLAGRRLGVVLALLVTTIICVWVANSGSSVRYALYALPALMILSCAMVMHWRIATDRRGLIALAIYAAVAALTVASNHFPGEFATRDLLLITGYLTLFVVFLRAPRFLADACLLGLAVATAIVALKNGISFSVDFISSGGMLESPLAFPLGIVFLYYVGSRQWGRATLAFLLFFLAFKRIALLGVFGALAVEFAIVMLIGRRFGRLWTAIAVVAVSLFALFLLQIFDQIAILLNNEDISANGLSLGRAGYAEHLWREIAGGGLRHLLVGFGPGAADHSLSVMAGDPNPHNDWLKIFFDYGALGFLALHAVLYLIHPDTPFGNRAYVYLAIVMATDNLLIYVFYFVYLFLLLRIAEPRERWR